MMRLFDIYEIHHPDGMIHVAAETPMIVMRMSIDMGLEGHKITAAAEHRQECIKAAIRKTLMMRAGRSVRRPQVYLAAPLRAFLAGRTTGGNVVRAQRHLHGLLGWPWWDVICPWLAELHAAASVTGKDYSVIEDESRAEGLERSVATAGRCDGIVLAGDHVSDGMAEEMSAVIDAGGFVTRLLEPASRFRSGVEIDAMTDAMMSIERFGGEDDPG